MSIDKHQYGLNMNYSLDRTHLDELIGRVFHIEDITIPDSKDAYLVRYRGRLRDADSEAAYDRLVELLRPMEVTPLFRMDKDQHVILLAPNRPTPKPSNPWINLVLFILTLLSVTLVGGLNAMTEEPTNLLRELPGMMLNGWPFALSLLGILGAHEFGHYLVGRAHGVHLTLPYFIPLPLPPFGTMGAVINMKEPPKNRRHLLDIALAGPIAGLVVAIPVLLLGLSLSHIEPLSAQIPTGSGLTLEGNSLLYLFLKFVTFGELLPSPASFNGLPPLLYWLRYFFTGQPIPLGGYDVMLHPVAWAGWGGIFVTALNLIPAGQLDGGHLLYVLMGRVRASRLFPFVLAIVFVLGFFYSGWWLWLALLFVLGRVYAEPLDQITPLDDRRRALAVLGLIIFALVFTPVPLNVVLPPGS
jgi:membrane-associated protease RseP (regulator of RpoE activity)